MFGYLVILLLIVLARYGIRKLDPRNCEKYLPPEGYISDIRYECFDEDVRHLPQAQLDDNYKRGKYFVETNYSLIQCGNYWNTDYDEHRYNGWKRSPEELAHPSIAEPMKQEKFYKDCGINYRVKW